MILDAPRYVFDLFGCSKKKHILEPELYLYTRAQKKQCFEI